VNSVEGMQHVPAQCGAVRATSAQDRRCCSQKCTHGARAKNVHTVPVPKVYTPCPQVYPGVRWRSPRGLPQPLGPPWRWTRHPPPSQVPVLARLQQLVANVLRTLMLHGQERMQRGHPRWRWLDLGALAVVCRSGAVLDCVGWILAHWLCKVRADGHRCSTWAPFARQGRAEMTVSSHLAGCAGRLLLQKV